MHTCGRSRRSLISLLLRSLQFWLRLFLSVPQRHQSDDDHGYDQDRESGIHLKSVIYYLNFTYFGKCCLTGSPRRRNPWPSTAWRRSDGLTSCASIHIGRFTWAVFDFGAIKYFIITFLSYCVIYTLSFLFLYEADLFLFASIYGFHWD